MSCIFKVKVISGICFKQTFLCAEQLHHIQAASGICLKKKFFVMKKYIIYI